MDYKSSYYNFIYDDLGTDKTVFYNSSTGALAIVKDAQYQEYKNYINNHREFEDKEFFENLKKCGYIVPNSMDEKFMLHLRLMENRYTGNTLFLTIAPTMACNFRCVYCFEKGHYGNKMMDETTKENVLSFFKVRAKGVKRVFVSWYGGEPLMGMPVIEDLAKEFISYCDLNNIEYISNVTTNGYLFTETVAKKLAILRVKFVQITLDGPKEIHDTRRPLVNGQGTFDVIMKNLIATKGILPVSLRINADEENIEKADEIIKELKANDLLGTVKPYLAQVFAYNGTYEDNICLTSEKYSKANLLFVLKNGLSFNKTYPKPRGHYCGADYCNGWVIDDHGNLYKCWNDIGINSRIVGNVKDSPNIQNTEYPAKYMLWDISMDSKCRDCSIAPVCLGGCPHNRINNQIVCAHTLKSLKEYILAYANHVISNQKADKAF